jgi:type IX secretion system substrate protein/galactose oxidase-like protein
VKGSRYLPATRLRILIFLLVVLAVGALPRPALAQEFSGDWFETNAFPRTTASVIYDPVRHRLLLFGGFGGDLRNDVWSFDLIGSPGWMKVATIGTPPPPLSDPAAVYDPGGDRMIICSGLAAGVPGGGCYDGFNRTAYALTLSGQPEWKTLATGGYGAAGVSAVYDSRRNRVIVFGGLTFGCLCGSSDNDAYALDLGATPKWSHLHAIFPIGMPPPSTRWEHVAVYDSLGDRMIVFGGDSGNKCSTNYLSDVWSLSMDSTLTWTKLDPGSGPTARARMVEILDSARNRMVVFGGAGFSDTWALDLTGGTSWSPISTSGPAPSNTVQGAAAYDIAGDRLLYQNGSQTSALSLASGMWSTLDQVPAIPIARGQFASIVDPVRRRYLVFGGYDGNTLRNDVWALSLDSPWPWQQLFPSGTPPSQRRDLVAIYDPKGDQMVLFGGNGNLQDTWVLHLSPSLSWEQLQPTGTLPYARSRATAIYDPAHSAMILFGGYDGFSTLLNDVRSLSLDGPPTWTQLQPDGTPPAGREGQVAVYDPVGGRMIVVGGATTAGMANDTWGLTLSDPPVWSPLAPTGTLPPVRLDAVAFYDDAGQRLIQRGGVSYASSTDGLSDMWALSLWPAPHWNLLAPAGQGPSRRSLGGAGYDSLTGYAVYFGGNESGKDGGGRRSDAWLLDLQDTAVPIPLALLSASVMDGSVRLEWYATQPGIAAAVYRRTVWSDWEKQGDAFVGPDGTLRFEDHDVEAGGRYGYRVGYASGSGEVFTAEIWVDVTVPHALAFTSLAPNPASSRIGIAFSLPSPTGARLEILDLRGRVVLHEDLSAAGAGNHTLEFQPKLAAGMYIVRLSQGGRSISHKLVLAGR